MNRTLKSSRTLRYLVITAMLSAISAVLQLLEFPLPFLIPSFVQMDFSDLPALIGSFSMGPLYGVAVCLMKNLIHLVIFGLGVTGGVGELANFLLSASFVLAAGLIYHFKKNRLGALIGSLVGALFMGLLSVPVNLFITYPIYYNLMPKEVILGLYQAILPFVDSITECLWLFNAPFTLLKGLLVSAIAFLIYKKISPLIKGKS